MMRRAGLAGLVWLVLTGAAGAFDFTPETFGQIFNERTARLGSDLRIKPLQCSPEEGGYCDYVVNDNLMISVHRRDGSEKAGRMSVWTSEAGDFISFGEVRNIAFGLCSPGQKTDAYEFALETAYDNDEVPNPSVHVLLRGVRYGLNRLPDNKGRLFLVEDVGTWHG